MSLDEVHFFADPCCPWSWNTGRWLADLTGRTNTSIVWRSLSVAELNRDTEVSAHFAPRLVCSRRMARVFEGLRAEHRNDDIAAMFLAFGAHIHIDDGDPDELIDSCAERCGLDIRGIADLADDPSLDTAIAASVDEAMELVGPGVGSPIIAAPRMGRAFFGPIVSPPPTGDDALALWSIVETALRLDTFFELKRGRKDGVTFGPRS